MFKDHQFRDPLSRLRSLRDIPSVRHFSIITNFNTNIVSNMGIKILIQIDTLEAYKQ